jgi:hypothetical protein
MGRFDCIQIQYSDIVLFMLMLSFPVVIESDMLTGSKSVQAFIVLLYRYCHYRSHFLDLVWGVGVEVSLTLSSVCMSHQ